MRYPQVNIDVSAIPHILTSYSLNNTCMDIDERHEGWIATMTDEEYKAYKKSQENAKMEWTEEDERNEEVQRNYETDAKMGN